MKKSKTLASIKTLLIVGVLALIIQSCHFGLGLGIGSSKDKNSSEEKGGLVKNTNETDSTKTIGTTTNR